jgi:hypothetical protein
MNICTVKSGLERAHIFHLFTFRKRIIVIRLLRCACLFYWSICGRLAFSKIIIQILRCFSSCLIISLLLSPLLLLWISLHETFYNCWIRVRSHNLAQFFYLLRCCLNVFTTIIGTRILGHCWCNSWWHRLLLCKLIYSKIGVSFGTWNEWSFTIWYDPLFWEERLWR